jgi:epoxyqueuosine reductase
VSLADAIKSEALTLGFDRVGFCDAALPPEAAHFERWLDAGMHGTMEWMRRGRDRRLDPALILPGTRSLILVARAYASPVAAANPPGPPPEGGLIARYARGGDYHVAMGTCLERLADFVERSAPGHRALSYVDTGAVLERMWAARAGIGWIGKNALVLNEDMGSWFFLGAILTTLPLPADAPALDQCGACALCIAACPTQAIVAPRLVDSRLCLSYHTIELRGDVPEEHRATAGDRLFGCDDCQDACPWNRQPAAAGERHAHDDAAPVSDPSLVDLLEMTHEEYLRRFRGSAIKRATWQGLRRNAAIVLGNRLPRMEEPGRGRALRALERVAGDPSQPELVRRHAAWAVSRLSLR